MFTCLKVSGCLESLSSTKKQFSCANGYLGVPYTSGQLQTLLAISGHFERGPNTTEHLKKMLLVLVTK